MALPVVLSGQVPNSDWSDSRKAQYYYEKAEAAVENKDFSQAEGAATQCLALKPSYQEAYYVRGRAREGLQDFAGAITDYSICLDMNPQSSEALFSRAQLRFRLRQFDLAREDFLRLLEAPPSETTSVFFQIAPSGGVQSAFTTHGGNHRSRVFDYLGRLESAVNNFAQSDVYFDSALQLASSNPDIHLHKGQSLLLRRDRIRAEQSFRQALALDPGNASARYQLAMLKGSITTEESDRLLRESIEGDSLMPQPYMERAHRRMEAADYRGALSDYGMAVVLGPEDPEHWFGRGTAKEKLEDWQGAYDDYTEALRRKPGFEKALLNRGNVLFKLKLYQEAIDDYNLALTHFPDYGPGYYNRAVANYYLRNSTQSCADIRKAEQLGIKADVKLKEKVCR
jgi:tetratricopeptide (TPR) repeat protein